MSYWAFRKSCPVGKENIRDKVIGLIIITVTIYIILNL